MRLPLSLTVRLPLLFVLALFAAARCPAQALPDLGDSSQAVFTPTTERRLGESIMERVRRDRAYMDDPVITDYLASLGNRLVSASPDSRQSFEFFLIEAALGMHEAGLRVGELEGFVAAGAREEEGFERGEVSIRE